MKGSSRYWVAVLLLFAVAYGASLVVRQQRSEAIAKATADADRGAAASPSMRPFTKLTLTSQSAEPVDLGSLSGRPWVVSFFFTGCAGTCFQLNQALAEMRVSAQDRGVRFVSITCDPDNDTPEALAHYAKRFDADAAQWMFLTGKMDDLKRVAKSMNLVLERAMHSDRAFLVNADGRITHKTGFRLTVPEDVKRLKKALAELPISSKAAASAAQQTLSPKAGASAAQQTLSPAKAGN